MKKIVALSLILSMAFLGGCTIFQQLFAEADKANNFVEEFCFALAYDGIEKAKEYLHPDWLSTHGNLEDYVEKFEYENGIDFSDGVAISRRFRQHANAYTSEYGGAVYEFGISIVIGDKIINMSFMVVDNDDGYGIYDFGLYVPDYY